MIKTEKLQPNERYFSKIKEIFKNRINLEIPNLKEALNLPEIINGSMKNLSKRDAYKLKKKKIKSVTNIFQMILVTIYYFNISQVS